jgi:hypothetical protein
MLVALASMFATATSYPEFTPGEGIPSLADLGLTSKELFTTPPTARKSQLSLYLHYPTPAPVFTSTNW